jgi:hypothetical protein
VIDVTPASLTGILVPECCLEVWDAETTITAASPITAQLVADRATKLRVLASGTPIASDGLDLLASTGGVAGSGARFLARPTEDPAVDWRGMDPPIALSGFALNSTSTGLEVRAVQVCTTTSGREVLIREEADTGPALRPTEVIARTRPRGSTTWTTVADPLFEEAVGGSGMSPRLVRTESGRLDVYLLSEETSPQTLIRISSHDDGLTWEQASTGILQVAADRLTIQVAEGNKQVLLFVNSDDGSERDQYASSDGGNSFEYVGTADGHTLAVTYDSGLFVELTVVDISSSTKITAVQYGSASTAGTPSGGAQVKGEAGADALPLPRSSGALFATPDGTLYAYWIPTISAAFIGSMRVYFSTDGGTTWDATARDLYIGPTALAPFDSFAIAPGDGCASIVFGAGECVYHGRVGGWSTRTLPSRYAGPLSLAAQSRWRSTFLAIKNHGLDDMPATWAEVLTATPTITKNAGFLRFVGTTGDAVEYTYTLTAESDHGQTKIGIATASGDGLTTLTMHLTTTEATARTFGFTVSLNYDTGLITVRDDADASVLYGPVAIPLGNYEFFLAVGRSAFTTFTAYLGLLDLDEDGAERVYEHLLDAEPLTAFGSPETSSKFVFATDDAADFDARILYVFADLQEVTGYGLGRAVGVSELFGAPIGPRPTYVRDGVSARAQGSVDRLDSWAMTPSTYYAVANALPSVLASPRRGHLSTSTAGANYAFQLTTGGDASRGGLWAIYLDGITYASATISIRTGGAWSSLGSVSFGERAVWDSVAGTLIPAESPDVPRRWREGALVGCRFQDSDNTIGECIASDEGVWSEEGHPTRVRLDGDITAGSARVGTIWHRRAVVYLYLADGVLFEGVRLAVVAYSGGPTIGTDVIGIGRVRVLGDGPDQTRAVATELGAELVEIPEGGASAYRTRPDRRSVELSHVRTVGLDAEGYVRALEAGPAVGSSGDPATLEGLVRHVGRDPLVYLPSIPVRSGSASALAVDLGAVDAVYGRFVPSSYRIEHSTNKLVRTSVVTIVEEV